MSKKTKTEATVQELTPEQEKVRSLSQAREERCDPIVKLILEKMLSQDILLTDKSYIEQKVKQFFEALFQDMVYEHLNEVQLTVERSLELALQHAQKLMWAKSSHEITVGDIENVFSKSRKTKK